MKLSKALGAVCVAVLAVSTWAATPPIVTITVDATTAPRKIFHASLKIPATPGDLTLYYPKWIPGEHAPDGPVIDLAGLKFSAAILLEGKAGSTAVGFFVVENSLPHEISTPVEVSPLTAPDGQQIQSAQSFEIGRAH